MSEWKPIETAPSEDANTHMLIETCLQLGQRVGKLENALKKQVSLCMTCKGTGKVFVGDSADLNEDRYTIEACPGCSDAREALTVEKQ